MTRHWTSFCYLCQIDQLLTDSKSPTETQKWAITSVYKHSPFWTKNVFFTKNSFVFTKQRPSQRCAADADANGCYSTSASIKRVSLIAGRLTFIPLPPTVATPTCVIRIRAWQQYLHLHDKPCLLHTAPRSDQSDALWHTLWLCVCSSDHTLSSFPHILVGGRLSNRVFKALWQSSDSQDALLSSYTLMDY